MRVAVELDEVARFRVVPHEALPEARRRAQLDDESSEGRPVEVRVLGNALVNPSRQAFCARRRDGFLLHTVSATASPKPRTASRASPGSSVGASLPKRTLPTPRVERQSSSARRPYDALSKETVSWSVSRPEIPLDCRRSS